MAPKTNVATALDRSRSMLEEIDSKIATLVERRKERLLAGDNAVAIAKIDGEIAPLQQAAKTEADRIAVLQVEADREAAEQRAREHKALIGRIERKFAERDAAVVELAAAVKAADDAFRKVVRLGRDLTAAWAWMPHDAVACLLPPGSILTPLRHELFRVGSRPNLLGGQVSPDAGLDFPGGQSPTLELRLAPSLVTPMVEVFAQASRCASEILHTGKSTSGRPVSAVVDGVPAFMLKDPPPLTPAQRHLGELQRKLSDLSRDVSPEGEQKYLAVVAELAAVEAEAGIKTGVEPS
jgi:hypothetical protein